MHTVSNPQRVALGIGDVDLPVHLFPYRTDPEAHGTLHLRNVLHVPSSYCNIIGSSDTGDYSTVRYEPENQWAEITTEDDRRLGYFDNRGLFTLKLSNPPAGVAVGPSAVRMILSVNATWLDSERERWAVKQAGYPGGCEVGAAREDEVNAASGVVSTGEKTLSPKREWERGIGFSILAAINGYVPGGRQSRQQKGRKRDEKDT